MGLATTIGNNTLAVLAPNSGGLVRLVPLLGQGPAGPSGPVGATGSYSNNYVGVWNSVTAYVTGNIVSNGGSSWLALAGSTNVVPVEGATWTAVALGGVNGVGVFRVKAATNADTTLSGPQTVDGVSLVAGDRVLVRAQTLGQNNGVYVVNAGAWTRATDADTALELASAIVETEQGTTNGGVTYTTRFKSTDTLGTTNMIWGLIRTSAFVVQVSEGGTGSSSALVQGGVAYGGTTTSLATTATGNTGQFLQAGGTSAPSWQTLPYKIIVKVATTGNITLSAPQTVDGIAVVAGDRVLVKNQTATQDNGVYNVNAGAWTRTVDTDTATEIAGAVVSVDQGTQNFLWATPFKSTDTLGTTGMFWGRVLTTATIVSVAQGGTGQSAALVQGGLVYGASTTAMGVTAAPAAAGQQLVGNGTGAPFWVTPYVKARCIVATTANITLSAPQTIDGVAVVAGDRVLVKNQTTASENGIYDVAAGAWARSYDADTSAKMPCAIVVVNSGTANAGLRFTTTFKSTDTLGTTSMGWSVLMTLSDNDGRYARNTLGGAEKVAAASATTGSTTLDVSTASIFTVTPTGNITAVNLTNVPAAGTACTITFIVSQGATPFTIATPTGGIFLGASTPTQIANKVCVFTYLTVDGGTTWICSASVQV